MNRAIRPDSLRAPLERSLTAGALAVFAIVVLRTAWVADDAYITLRSVTNLVDGFGPRWNVAERVQTYTHPLWMLLVSAGVAVTHEPYFTLVALSIATSVAAVVLLLRQAQSADAIVLCAVLLLSSKAFIDYSTSGLENPLTHLCLALAALAAGTPPFTIRRAGRLMLVASLAMLTRLDNVLLLAPLVGVAAWRVGWRRAWRPLVLGSLPIAAWLVFALVYYGAPFPNTVYAKVGTGIPAAEYAAQGLVYLADSLQQDPVTLPTCLVGLAILVASRQPLAWPIAAGVLLHLAYVVRIGGDFMSGRFLTPAFFWVVLALARSRFDPPRWALPAACLAVVAIGQLGSGYPLWSGGAFDTTAGARIPASGIADERRYYYQTTGLLRTGRRFQPPVTDEPGRVQRLLAEPREVVPRDAVGIFGFEAGRRIHVIDVLGLGDPLIARLPSQRPWRIGHFYRAIPAGYAESLPDGPNRIEDANIHRYYDDLALAIRGPLFDRARWAAIVRLNLRRDERWLDPMRRGLFSLWSSSVPSAPPPEAGDAPQGVDIRQGLHVILAVPATARAIELGLDRGVDYRVTVLRHRAIVSSALLRRDARGERALSIRRFALPAPATIDVIEILPRRGEPPYRLGHLRIETR